MILVRDMSVFKRLVVWEAGVGMREWCVMIGKCVCTRCDVACVVWGDGRDIR